MASNLQTYFCNPSHTLLYLIISVFFSGLIFSPLNNGIVISLSYLLLLEIVGTYMNYGRVKLTDYIISRIICISVYLSAFLLGRFISRNDSITLGFPFE